MVDEIKASINYFNAAKYQMIEQTRLLEFGIWSIFGNELEPKNIVKKGQFFVLEAEADHQSLKSTFDEEQSISMLAQSVSRKR